MDDRNRLIESDQCGNWRLKGVKWDDLYEGKVITENTYQKLYAALCKLKEYEDTGLSPEQLEAIDEMYREKCEEVVRMEKRSD